MHWLGHDLRFAFRQLRNSFGFTATVVLTLALGIGATTAMFSLIEGILLRPLPFHDPDRLVVLGDHLNGGTPGIPVTAREIATYSRASEAFSSMGGFDTASYELSGGELPEEVHAARLCAGVMPTLGVRPILGRSFTQEEEDGRQPVAVISYALWLNRYRSDPHILGTSIVLDRKVYSIIGVMPRNFEFPLEAGHLDQPQLWLPMSLTPEELSDEHAGFWGYHIVARLKDGVNLPQAAKDADRVARQIMPTLPARVSAIRIQGDVTLLREYDISEARPLLRTLFLAVFTILLIACANVAGLMLVRAIRRRREYALRLALGAGASVIVREAILEGILLGLGGGLLGLVFSAVAIRTALRLLPESMPRIDAISTDATVVMFAMLLAVATGGLCSLAPAFVALKTGLIESLKQVSQSGTSGPSHTWLQSALVVAEISVALVLVTVSGAFLRSLQKMEAVDPGFRPEHVLVASYQLPLRQYPTTTVVDSFNRQAVDVLARKPGTVAVGITTTLPASDFASKSAYTIEGTSRDAWKLKFAGFAITYGDYFRAMDIPLLEGRTFTEDDRSNTPLVVIVNQSMASHSWPNQSAIGKRMHAGGPQNGMPWATVVGVVGDTKLGSRDEPNEEQWYVPATQPATLYGSKFAGSLSDPMGEYITMRSALPPEQMIQTLRSAIAELDPMLALQQVQPMNDVISNVEAPRRFNTDLITTFAAGALLLAVTGIYAVLAFAVSVRKQEISIRMALGAQRSEIVRIVLFSAAKMALAGCTLGVLGSLAVSRLVSSFLFEVSATDPFIYVAGILVMMVMVVAASAIPAMRAASADPIDALRAI